MTDKNSVWHKADEIPPQFDVCTVLCIFYGDVIPRYELMSALSYNTRGKQCVMWCDIDELIQSEANAHKKIAELEIETRMDN